MMVAVAAIIHVLYDVPSGRPLLVAAAACLLIIGLSFASARLLVLLTQALADRHQPHRHLLQPGVRLRRRWIPGRGDGRLPEGLGLDPAAALVPSDPVRSGGARLAAFEFRPTVHHPCRPRLPLFALAWLRLRAIAVRRRDARPAARPASNTGGRRHRDEQRGAAHSRRPIGLRPDRARADHLRPALPAALSRPGPAQHSDRGRRSGPDRAQPRPRAGPERRRGARGRGAGEHARGGAGRAGPARGLRHPGHPQGHRAAGPAGRAGAARGLCRCRLFPALQPHPAGHIGSRGDRLRRHRAARRAHGRQPRLCGAGRRARRSSSCRSRCSTRPAAMPAMSCRPPSC